jgi:hypothetical protein
MSLEKSKRVKRSVRLAWGKRKHKAVQGAAGRSGECIDNRPLHAREVASDKTGGDYDLVSSMVIWCGYSGKKMGDTRYLGGQQYLPEAGLSKSLSH